MRITTNSWHYKLFKWWMNKSDSRLASDYKWDDVRPNLCPYMRIVLFRAPMLFIWARPQLWYTLGTIFLGGNAIVYHFHGWRGIRIESTLIALLLVIIALVVGVVAGIGWLRNHVKAPEPVTSFATVTREYIRSIHDGICPIIEFVRPESESKSK